MMTLLITILFLGSLRKRIVRGGLEFLTGARLGAATEGTGAMSGETTDRGGVAEGASRHNGDLPGPGRRLRRSRPQRRPRCDPGGGPVASMAQPGGIRW